MTTLWIIIGLLFGYSVYMTFWGSKNKHPQPPICGVLEIADGEDGEPPYIFLNTNVSPTQLKNGEMVQFYVHKIVPRK